ncbi:MAG: Gldg family protein, partial [Ruthenibacterium sp.]
MKKIFNRKNGVKSVYTALMILALIIVILVNIVMGVLADRYPLSIDLTSAGLFGLSDGTAAYLKTLQTPVTIQVLAKEDVFENNSTYNAQANEVMRQFAKHAGKVNLRYIDYVADPTFASKYPDFTLKHGDVIVSGGGKDRLVKTEELFNYAYSDKGEMTIASSRAEEAILSAILYVTSDSIPKVAVVQGHN